MINILLINRHSYCFLSMSVLDGAHEYFDDNNDQDDNFIMMMMILAMIMIFKCLLLAIDFATCYSTRYLDFLSQPYSNLFEVKKAYWLGPGHIPCVKFLTYHKRQASVAIHEKMFKILIIVFGAFFCPFLGPSVWSQ